MLLVSPEKFFVFLLVFGWSQKRHIYIYIYICICIGIIYMYICLLWAQTAPIWWKNVQI